MSTLCCLRLQVLRSSLVYGKTEVLFRNYSPGYGAKGKGCKLMSLYLICPLGSSAPALGSLNPACAPANLGSEIIDLGSIDLALPLVKRKSSSKVVDLWRQE